MLLHLVFLNQHPCPYHQGPALIYHSSFGSSPQPQEVQAGEQERIWERVLRGEQQDTLIRYIIGRQKMVILHPQLLEHFYPHDTPFLGQEGRVIRKWYR